MFHKVQFFAGTALLVHEQGISLPSSLKHDWKQFLKRDQDQEEPIHQLSEPTKHIIKIVNTLIRWADKIWRKKFSPLQQIWCLLQILGPSYYGLGSLCQQLYFKHKLKKLICFYICNILVKSHTQFKNDTLLQWEYTCRIQWNCSWAVTTHTVVYTEIDKRDILGIYISQYLEKLWQNILQNLPWSHNVSSYGGVTKLFFTV